MSCDVIHVSEVIKLADEAFKQGELYLRHNNINLSFAQEWFTAAKTYAELVERGVDGQQSAGGKQLGFPSGRSGLRARIDYLKDLYGVK